MRQITTITFLLFCVLNIRSANAQINPSIGSTGGACWENGSGTVTCRDVTNSTSLGSYTFGAGNGGLSSFENFLAYGSDDTTDTVQIRNMDDNATCVVEGHGFGLGGSATHVYVTNYYQNKLVKVANDLSAGSCSAASDVFLLGQRPSRIINLGVLLYVLNRGNAVSAPSIDVVDTANGDMVTTHTFGAVDTDDVMDMVYDPSSDSFIITYDSGHWAVSRSTWNRTSWGDLSIAMGAIDYLDGFISSCSWGDMTGYIIDPATPNNDVPLSLTIALDTAMGYSSAGLTAFFMTGTGLRAFNLSGVEQAFSPITSDVGGVVWVKPWVTGPVCQNGTKESGEDCDQSDLGGETCITQGFLGGTLGCTASCTFDASSCISQVCLNGTKEGTEECDGSDFGGATCQSLGFAGGTLSCSGTCTLDTTGCTMCGNGSIDSGEQCDGANLNGQTCMTRGFDGGTLGCNTGCSFDTSSCTTITCGNGTIEGNEDCDGADLNGQTCVSQGFAGGTLACEPGSCAFDTSGCTMCGNGNIDANEQCDGANLNGATCESQGFPGGGTLVCYANCTAFDVSSCSMSTCGNGVLDTGEDCDDNNTTDSDGCSSMCQVEDGYGCEGAPSVCSLLCGNGHIDDGEECDGTDFGGLTCADFGGGPYPLTCTQACIIDSRNCPSCNHDGLVQPLTEDDFGVSQLQGRLRETYEQAITDLQPMDQLSASCEEIEIFGSTVPGIVVDIEDGKYVHFRIRTETFTIDRLFFSRFGAARLAVSINMPTEHEIYGDGDVIVIHSGEDVFVKRGWNIIGTVGTVYGVVSATYNERQKKDGWFWALIPQTDELEPTEFGNEFNGIIIGMDNTGLPYYIDKANAQDLSEIGRVPRPPKKGCAGCSQSDGATPSSVMMFGLLMLWLLSVRRSRRSAPARIRK
jgi:cysteine-rich repeat protein